MGKHEAAHTRISLANCTYVEYPA